MEIILDASFLIATYIPTDPHHKRAVHFLEKVDPQTQLTTLDYYFGEAATVITMRYGKRTGKDFVSSLTNSNLRIELLDLSDWQQVLLVFERVQSKNISLFDCAAEVLFKKLQCDGVLSFDRDFRRLEIELID